jgi:MFS transporter, putative metabolite:H+ symporter
VLGQAANNYCRKPIFVLSAAMIAIFGIATATASDFQWLLACRWGVGFGVGGGTVPFDTLCEFLPRQQRGQCLLLIWYFWTFGTILVILLAYITLGNNTQQHQHNDQEEEG